MERPDHQGYPGSLPDWSNVDIVHRNTLPPRSSFSLYDDEISALTRDPTKARVKCLSGTWGFHLSKSPFDNWQSFYQPGFDHGELGQINVPGMWQMQGYGKGPQYTNINFPWPVDPPNVPYDENECGRYWKTFTVDEAFGRNRQLRLRFEGVDAAFTVWVNGQEIGYSQGSRNPSEFDITKAVYIGADFENFLAVAVYQRCDGSYLEDQDQWWLSGIFRDVDLHSFPLVHLEDFRVVTDLDEKYEDATLRVEIGVSAACRVELKLFDMNFRLVAHDTRTISSTGWIKMQLKDPRKWTAETPYLYTLILNLCSDDSCSLSQRIGFRSINLVDGVFCVNGNPIKIRGVNRHEHHPDHGRAVPYEFMKHDLLLMKRNNINAVRTCHQINDPRFYDLADELGLWVLDEADLECHGFAATGADAAKFTSDNPIWETQYVDRARQMVARDKNHACVIMWSLGNESFYGRNHQAMYDCIKEMDPTRLIHYEGDWFAETVDIFSRMYSPVGEIEDFAKERVWSKPLVLCEFLHAMGNSCGAAKEYIEAFYRHPRLMGGFVWEWANHGLRTKTKGGQTFMGYGGDFGDIPNDGNFIMDGMIFSNHTPSPNIIEYSKAIEPVQTLALDGRKITIVNRYDFSRLDHLQCIAEIVRDGRTNSAFCLALPKDVKPHELATLEIPETQRELLDGLSCESFVRLSFKLKWATNWAPKGHQVAFGELPLYKPTPLVNSMVRSPRCAMPQIQHSSGSHLAILSGTGSSTWRINLATGALSSWQKANREGVELLSEPLNLGFYRALTDNDRHGHGQNWVDRRLHQASHHVRNIEWKPLSDGLEVCVTGRIAPPVLAWAVEVVFTYSFHADYFTLHISGKPHGPFLPETFARIGITLGFHDVKRARWWGRGPGESYRDKKFSQAMGNWEADIDDLWTDYEFPQDGGNRTDVRWVEMLSQDGKIMKAAFGDGGGASFSAMHYLTSDIDECTHPYELHERKRRDTILRLDWMHHGLGTASCGPWTLPEHQLRSSEEFSVEVCMT